MKTKRLFGSGSVAAMFAAMLVSAMARTSAQQATAAALVQVDPDDVGGVVSGPKGPEAGVWVIAETTDLPTKFVRIVVTDDLAGSVTCDVTDLAVGESTGCTADAVYVITEDDETSGIVHNTAFATGTDPDDETHDSPPDDTETAVVVPRDVGPRALRPTMRESSARSPTRTPPMTRSVGSTYTT